MTDNRLDKLLFGFLGTDKKLDIPMMISAIEESGDIFSKSGNYNMYQNFVRNLLVKFIGNEELKQVVMDNILKVLEKEQSDE